MKPETGDRLEWARGGRLSIISDATVDSLGRSALVKAGTSRGCTWGISLSENSSTVMLARFDWSDPLDFFSTWEVLRYNEGIDPINRIAGSSRRGAIACVSFIFTPLSNGGVAMASALVSTKEGSNAPGTWGSVGSR